MKLEKKMKTEKVKYNKSFTTFWICVFVVEPDEHMPIFKKRSNEIRQLLLKESIKIESNGYFKKSLSRWVYGVWPSSIHILIRILNNKETWCVFTLSLIFEKSFIESNEPEQWRRSNVSPFFKKRHRDRVNK